MGESPPGYILLSQIVSILTLTLPAVNRTMGSFLHNIQGDI